MKMNEAVGSKVNIISSLVWGMAAAVLAVIFIVNGSWNEQFFNLVFGLLIIISIANIIEIFALFHKNKLIDIVNWGIYQSALLILIAFAGKFPAENRKAFWLGLGAITLLYVTTRLSSALLFKKFDNIDKL